MATNEIRKGCELSTEAVLASNHKRRRVKSTHNEIRHSNVLAWLLDPNGSHGLQDLFLRKWLMLVFYGIEPRGSSLDPIKIDTVPFRTVKVRREWHHVDVLLEIKTETEGSWVICIENKVRSSQGKDQLPNYRKEIERLFPGHVMAYIYLTVTREEPNDAQYVEATYEDVCSALEACLAEHSGLIGEGPGMLINHYLSILKERFMDNNEISKLVADIWKKHEEALDIILDNRPDNVRRLTETAKELITRDDFETADTNAWGRVHFMPKRWTTGQDPNNPAVRCDIKFSNTGGSGHPVLRAYVFPKLLQGNASDLVEKLFQIGKRKKSEKRYIFFIKDNENEELTVESIEDAAETEIPELAKKLVTWIKNKLSESTFKESEKAVTEYLASNNNRSSSSPSEQAGPVNERISTAILEPEEQRVERQN